VKHDNEDWPPTIHGTAHTADTTTTDVAAMNARPPKPNATVPKDNERKQNNDAEH
jgi:hypothetical protein